MIIAAEYSFNKGMSVIKRKYPHLLREIELIIRSVDAKSHKTKKSTEKTMLGRMLFAPRSMNAAFKVAFSAKGWTNQRTSCEYRTDYYRKGYAARALRAGAFRDMDFIKEKLGVEVQFGKYSFMVYNVCAKMTIFKKMGFINAGIEIVPVKQLADEMSSGVSYFEQFVWDLEARGIADIDVPVLIIGIDR